APAHDQARGLGEVTIGVRVENLAGIAGNPVDVATLIPIPRAGADRQLVLNERKATGQTGFVSRSASVRIRHFRSRTQGCPGEVRARGDVADGAALGAGSKQRSLRSAQDFDSIQIEHLGGDGWSQAVIALLDRGVINIKSRGRRAGCRSDPADRHIRIAQTVVGRNRQGRGLSSNVVEILDALAIEGFLTQGRDTDRNGHDGLGALLRGNDHFLEATVRSCVLTRSRWSWCLALRNSHPRRPSTESKRNTDAPDTEHYAVDPMLLCVASLRSQVHRATEGIPPGNASSGPPCS